VVKTVATQAVIVQCGAETEVQDKHQVTADILAAPLDIMVMDHILLAEEEVQQDTVTVAAEVGRLVVAELDYYLRLMAPVYIGAVAAAALLGLIPLVLAGQVEEEVAQQVRAVQQARAGLA
jgi:hypothetical protein